MPEFTISTQQLDYIHKEVLFFSIEHGGEYIHFYRDGTTLLTTQNDKLLSDLYGQFKHDDFGHAFYCLKERVDKLKNKFKGLNFHHDLIFQE